MTEPVVIGQFGSARNPILVTLSELDSGRIVDIRRYFRERESNELRPTQKGIAVQGANFNELMACLADSYGRISAWLEDGSQSDQAKRTRALTQAALSSKPPTLKRDSWRGASFFAVECLGAAVEVILNSQHPIDAELNSSANSGARQLLADLLATFEVAAMSATIDNKSRTVDLTQLEASWGLLLAQMLKRRREGSI